MQQRAKARMNASTEVKIDLLASFKVFADESRAMVRRLCILFTKAIALCQRVAMQDNDIRHSWPAYRPF